MKATYRTQFSGDTYEITADFCQAGCPVTGDEHGRQVADFRHSPRAAMRAQIEEAIEQGGDSAESALGAIDSALDAMEVVQDD